METYTERRPFGFCLLAGLALAALVVGYLIRAETRRSGVGRVLAEDKALHARLSAEATFLDVAWDQSGLTARYVDGMRRIDRSGCPADFEAAFDAHVRAWAAYEKVARRHGGFRGFFRGFLSGGTAVLDAAADAADAQAEVRRTWAEVLRVAREHGASGP